MADTGDPRLAAPIWVGRYEITPADGVTLDNAGVMLSKQQIVQLLGNASPVTAGSVFAILPSECRPDSEVMLPIVVTGSTSSEQEVTVNVKGGTATVDIPALSGSAKVPSSEVKVTVPPMRVTSEVPSSDGATELVSVDLDSDGVPQSALSLSVISDGSAPLSAVGTTPQTSVTATVPATEATVSTSPKSVSVDLPDMQATGTVVLESSLAVLTVSPDGEMKCSAGETVHLNGISFHICSNYY